MPDREKVIKGLEDIKNNIIPKIAAYYGSGASGMYASKYYKETLNNAISMLKEQERKIETLESERGHDWG